MRPLEVPRAPFGEQYAPGDTDSNVSPCGVDGAAVATGAKVVADATAGLVVTVKPDVDVAVGLVPHGATVVVAHEAVSKFLIRPNSLWSIESFQRAFMATHSERYVHVYDFCGGIQFDGSLSDFDRFCPAVTAMSARASDKSFAKAWRCAAVQFQAPESHASFRGIM